MSVNPIEVNFQLGRNVYCIRVSLTSGATPQVYNTDTQLYETYAAANWEDYAIALTETVPGYYRANCPTGSLGTPATEIYYERLGSVPATSDAPAIANGNSQGVNIGTINGVQSDIGANPTGIVDICNLALTHLGQKNISTLSDDSENARKCNQIFTTCRDEVLRGASWKFATVIEALVELTAEDVVGWSYVWTFPTDCVLVRKVFSDDSSAFDLPISQSDVSFIVPITNPEGIEYRVVYQRDLALSVIVSNANPSYVEYTGRVTDPSLYDALFKKALSYKLAAELAIILNGDDKQRDKMLQIYVVVMSEAARANGIEDGVPQRRKSEYLDARG